MRSSRESLTKVEREGDSLKLRADHVDFIIFAGGTILFEGTKSKEKALELYGWLIEKACPGKAGLLKVV